MEGSQDTEDGMARTPTERLLQQQIQTLVPRLSRHRRRALARGVLGALTPETEDGTQVLLKNPLL